MPRHPCYELNLAYKGYQGQDPEKANFIFVGLDANFSRDIQTSPSPKFFGEVLEYLADGVKYWNKHDRHHPFLSPDYRNCPGYKYHHSFSKMLSSAQITKGYADKISFVELLPFPTYDNPSNKFMKLFKESGDSNRKHLKRVDSWINSSENIRDIFIPVGVHKKILEIRDGKADRFHWLPTKWESQRPQAEKLKFRLNTLYTSAASTNKNIRVHIITHFSNAICDHHLHEIGTIIHDNVGRP